MAVDPGHSGCLVGEVAYVLGCIHPLIAARPAGALTAIIGVLAGAGLATGMAVVTGLVVLQMVLIRPHRALAAKPTSSDTLSLRQDLTSDSGVVLLST